MRHYRVIAQDPRTGAEHIVEARDAVHAQQIEHAYIEQGWVGALLSTENDYGFPPAVEGPTRELLAHLGTEHTEEETDGEQAQRETQDVRHEGRVRE